MLKVQKGHSSFSFLFKTACSFLFCFVFFFRSLCWKICFTAADQICFDLFLESAALATNGSLPKLHFDNHCNDITLTLQSHISPQGNHPLLVGPLLIEMWLKSAFWRKLQPLYCSSAFLKRETWISINNGPSLYNSKLVSKVVQRKNLPFNQNSFRHIYHRKIQRAYYRSFTNKQM